MRRPPKKPWGAFSCAEVLGRYSNHGPAGAKVKDLAEAAAREVRDEPWKPPKLVGMTRVRRIVATDMEAMIADYEGGMGCVLLSRKYDIAENTVLARLRNAGVEVTPQGVLTLGQVEEMAALRAQGWTLSALGKKYGVTRQTVATRLREVRAE